MESSGNEKQLMDRSENIYKSDVIILEEVNDTS